MYANLKVTTSGGKELAAWRVEVEPAGHILVHLDNNDGHSSYAEEAGVLRLRGSCTIEASF